MVSPELIKVAMPLKSVFDFRKHSKNMNLVRSSNFNLQNYEFEKRSDSIIEEGDLQKLEIELRRKQKKRIQNEERQNNQRLQNEL